MQRRQSCHWSLRKFKVWIRFLSISDGLTPFFPINMQWRESCCQDCCDFMSQLFLRNLSCFSKKGATLYNGCALPLLHLLKLSFFPYRVSKSSSQMKWCYFMLKVKEKFYRQINFKLFYHSLKTLKYVKNCCMVQSLDSFPHGILTL